MKVHPEKDVAVAANTKTQIEIDLPAMKVISRSL